LAQAETFLRNRNWIVGSSVNLREALAYIIQKKPKYVLISADHPNKKVRMLPKMLVQAFPVRVIGFAEKGSGNSTKNLLEMNLEYNLYPPVSGPAIERMILKMLKDDELRAQNENIIKTSKGGETAVGGNELITFKGETPGADAMKPSLDSQSSSSMINFQEPGTSGDPLGPAYRGGAQQARDPQSGFHDGNSSVFSPNPSSPERDTDSQSSRNKKAGSPIMESDYVPRAAPVPYRMRQEKEPKSLDGKTSIFVRGAQTSLNESVNLKGADTAEEISQSSNLACITVESPRFSGYLVCAMGRNRNIDKAFIDIIKSRLMRYLQDNGETLKDRDTMSLNVQPVHFTAWSLEQAEFLKKSVHDGDEIAIAFFPTPIGESDLKKSASDKMVMIQMNELQDDAAVEFDLYIFMPENNKYLLYTPQGRPFYGKQKGRLKEKGITHMHLRKEAAPNVQKYRAQNFLNDKIATYRATTKNRT